MASVETADHDAASGQRPDAGCIARDLLAWYARARRHLPWRAKPGEASDPYAVWLSEIMLQQTTVKAVAPYFIAFLERWPSVETLADADRDDVLAAWAGLGYYSRARNLHACAQVVANQHGGRFPENAAALRALPGIGPYTSAAIAAIAFGEAVMPVDGNVERVVARLFAVETPLPAAKPALKRLAETLVPDDAPGDFAQAMMDLGATLCSPRAPSCLLCPLKRACRAHAQKIAARLPVRSVKAARLERAGVAFVVVRGDGAVLLRRRPDQGLLGGMLEVPSTAWVEGGPEAWWRDVPVEAEWRAAGDTVRHTFTHFSLELTVQTARVGDDAELAATADPERCRWVARDDLERAALPSVMRKVLSRGFATLDEENAS